MINRFLLLLLLVPSLVFGETKPASPELIIKLEQIAKTLAILEEDQKQAESPEKLEKINAEISDLEYDFIEFATGLNLAKQKAEANEQPFSWGQEIYVLLSPIITELKEISEKPRQIQELKEILAKHQQDYQNTKKLLLDLGKIKTESKDPELLKVIKNFEERWRNELIKTETDITILSKRLNSHLSQKKSISDSISDIFDLFFKNRGKNLIIALALTFLFLFSLRGTYRFTNHRIARSKKSNKASLLKSFQVFYLFLAIFGTILIFAGILFLLEDWLLLLLTGLILLGIFWSTKQIIPKFWMQAVLILNSGPVRENERIEYQGIPFQVKKINFHTFLANPELENGTIRLPINDLAELRSFPTNGDEPWFPTKKNDWILLEEDDDQLHAQVVFQSPYSVILQNLGGSKIQIATKDFLGKHFTNLSSGFRISFKFGIDYKHQQLATSVIPEIFKTALEKKISSLGLDFAIHKISVELADAGASALNLAVIVDCEGKGAREYVRLQRLLKKFCVEICNEENYSIPFEQLQIHITKD